MLFVYKAKLKNVICFSCAEGYYGNPLEVGGRCVACDCHGNTRRGGDMDTCDAEGQCSGCQGFTEGETCDRCILGYYGTAVNNDCLCKSGFINAGMLNEDIIVK